MPDEQLMRNAVTLFFARMACRAEAPCVECVTFCRDHITPRALPVMAATIATAEQYGAEAGWGRLVVELACAEPRAEVAE